MSRFEIPLDAVQELAAKERVCVRPLIRRVVDTMTGESVVITLPCQSTRASRCPSCAAKAKALRIQQCAEGWHLEHEPVAEPPTEPGPVDDEALADPPEDDRIGRSTRRRDDVPDLPKLEQENRTIGRTFTAPDGKTYRPSMFITLTLPSYGLIRAGTGVPRDPARYDYLRAALDAIHFPKLLDRWFQNLRRCAGYKVQYFGAVEAQRRLAPHLHVATRGAIPRSTIHAVTKATYASIWWPQMRSPRYVDVLPLWDGVDYLDPSSGEPLATWQQAISEVNEDPEARPAHVLRFGTQVDVQGLLGGSADSDRAVRYLTKYLTKSVAETFADEGRPDRAYERHIDRLHREVRFLPCSPECENWLRFGVQPRNAGPGMVPGFCPRKAHDRENLGLGGRRVLVSRGWSGKTLSDHRADRAEVVRQALNAAGIEMAAAERMAAQLRDDSGGQRYQWSPVMTGAQTKSDLLMQTVLERRRWRAEYEQAKQLVGLGPPVDNQFGNRNPAMGEGHGAALHT